MKADLPVALAPSVLPTIEEAKRFLAQATQFEDVKRLKDIAEAVRAYAHCAHDRELEAHGMEIRLWAQWHAGRILDEARRNETRHGKGRHKLKVSPGYIYPLPTLEELKTTKLQASRWMKISRTPEDEYREVISGQIARLMNPDPLFSSDSDEWLTPMRVLEAASSVMGAIDLDPCAEVEKAPHNVPAAQHFAKSNDGLAQLWRGRVFMNPPYSEVDSFTEKVIREWRAGMVEQAIVLVAARTDTRWWRMFQISPVCFLSGRLDFRRPGKEAEKHSAPFPSAVFYVGPESKKRQFCAAFAQLGQIRDTVIAG